jgi:endonuclease YncB( thermonuclease family)
LILPRECASRSVLALKFKIGSRFVHCNKQWTKQDRTIVAVCYIDGDDLGAWMLENGWAAALPFAPFEYELLERIARTHQVGMWGFQADHLIR